MTVLVLARDFNPSVDRVVRALGARGVSVFRTDLAAFPRRLTVDARLGSSGWDGVLSSLDVLWVNRPSAESDAVKPRQLDVARRCGLSVPDSQVTNRPAEVRDFAATVGGPLVGKTLAASLRVESGRLQMAYTRRIEPYELDDLAGRGHDIALLPAVSAQGVASQLRCKWVRT